MSSEKDKTLSNKPPQNNGVSGEVELIDSSHNFETAAKAKEPNKVELFSPRK